MTWRLTALGVGFVLYTLAWVAALEGSTALLAVLVTSTVLVVFIAGGNWLQHWLGIRRRPPQFARPDIRADAGDDDEVAG